MDDTVTFGYEAEPETITIDLKGVSLLIGSPCGSGRYDRAYVRSFVNSVIALRQWGAKVDWAEMPYCADLALARAKLFGTFYRSKHTHFLGIDDDMGWQPQDIARILMLKRDFVAGVGQKKTDPLSGDIEFAFHLAPTGGTPIPFKRESHTGLMEVASVGAAFVLITHGVAERMVQAYSNLEFTNTERVTDHALFNPIVVNKRYLSEDYAFCYRWREIGGHIHVLPDIRLKHAGPWTWEASLSEAFETEIPEKMKGAA